MEGDGCEDWRSLDYFRIVSNAWLSSPAHTLGSCVRIPLEAWMSMCVCSVFVPSCVQVAALRRADPPSKESYRLCKRLRNWKSVQGPTKGCRAIDEWMNPMPGFGFSRVENSSSATRVSAGYLMP
jgi:hypothetical protein